jgi:hypothetical protein
MAALVPRRQTRYFQGSAGTARPGSSHAEEVTRCIKGIEMGQNSPDPDTDYPFDDRLDLLNHELGNVLAGLTGIAGQLRASGLNMEQQRWLKAIEASTRQLQALVRESGGLVPRQVADRHGPARRVDGIDLLEQVITSHWPAARAKNDRLLLVVSPVCPRFWRCDPRLLRQLLDNLVGNAVKYTTSGEIVVEAFSTAHRGEKELCLQVGDSGPGIDAGWRERVFEPYRQVDCRQKGSGLGLFLCRQITRALGGVIFCGESEAGGAQFCVKLPGVPGDTDADGFRPAAMGRVVCRLEPTGALRRSLVALIERLGARWTRHAEASDIPSDGLCIRISEPAGDNPAGLILQHEGSPAKDGVFLPSPITESTLGPALLGMVLARRLSARDRPG